VGEKKSLDAVPYRTAGEFMTVRRSRKGYKPTSGLRIKEILLLIVGTALVTGPSAHGKMGHSPQTMGITRISKCGLIIPKKKKNSRTLKTKRMERNACP